MASEAKKILVVGGGIAGMTAAVEAAEYGREVVLVEKSAYLGGRVAQMNKYFPKLCPPSCGLEINYQRLRKSARVRVLTQAEVVGVSGTAGALTVELEVAPRYVNEKCTCCGKCAEACTVEVASAFDYGMKRVKGAYLPHPHAYPAQYVLAPELVADAAAAQAVADACPYGAIELGQTKRTEQLEVGAIVWATGWEPFDPRGIEYYGYGKHKNVVTNVQFERLAAETGPTGGKIVRPSDGAAPKRVVFVQCAGSRDENYLAYCSGVCCLASLKQATYVREQHPEAEVTICYIDIRTPDRLEDFYVKVKADEKVRFVKSKIASVKEDGATGEVTLLGEDTLKGERFEAKADLVVLATGIVPSKPKVALATDAYGFLLGEQGGGQYAAGCALSPLEVSSAVQEATGAALSAIHSSK